MQRQKTQSVVQATQKAQLKARHKAQGKRPCPIILSREGRKIGYSQNVQSSPKCPERRERGRENA